MYQIASWNVRGLNDSSKHVEVRKLIFDNKISCIALIENKLNLDNLGHVCNSIWPKWKYTYNGSNVSRCRILIGWNPDVWDLHVLDNSNQFIHAKLVSIANDVSCFATFVYGSNYIHERNKLWADIVKIASRFQHEPWVVLGDFNAIRFSHEKEGGTRKWPRHMNDFNKCVLDSSLEDLKYTGMFFTWQNNNGDYLIRRKLDRVLVNDRWLISLPNSEARFLSHCVSDHTPMLASLGIHFDGGPKPFKFFNHWIDFPEFKSTVSKAWNLKFNGHKMFILSCKFKAVKDALKMLSSRKKMEVGSDVRETREKVA